MCYQMAETPTPPPQRNFWMMEEAGSPSPSQQVHVYTHTGHMDHSQ